MAIREGEAFRQRDEKLCEVFSLVITDKTEESQGKGDDIIGLLDFKSFLMN